MWELDRADSHKRGFNQTTHSHLCGRLLLGRGAQLPARARGHLDAVRAWMRSGVDASGSTIHTYILPDISLCHRVGYIGGHTPNPTYQQGAQHIKIKMHLSTCAYSMNRRADFCQKNTCTQQHTQSARAPPATRRRWRSCSTPTLVRKSEAVQSRIGLANICSTPFWLTHCALHSHIITPSHTSDLPRAPDNTLGPTRPHAAQPPGE